MKQRHLIIQDTTRLFEELCTVSLLRDSFKAVKKNKGSPGTDGVTVELFDSNLHEELAQLVKDLSSWSYRPSPVKGVEIPKPGSKEKRLLGVPTVRDRVVQTGIKMLLEPIFEPVFSENSYGFRPGRSQHDAVKAARDIVSSGKEFCVDIDLSKFFDRVHHDRLLCGLGQVIPDKRILKLIGMSLRSGIMKRGLFQPTTKGTTQGSPLSPLLSNFVLDELDKELERRGFEFCRYADDCNIFTKSKVAAERAMANISKFIEKRLKLKVNTEKSKVALAKHVKFLGFTIVAAAIAISPISINRAMKRIRDLSPRGTHYNLDDTIERFNVWYRGWSNYYALTYYPAQLKTVEAHFRRRLRSRIISQQKSRRNLCNKLKKQGISRRYAANTVYTNRGRWALSRTNALHKAFPNEWFEQRGLYTASDRTLAHWFDVEKWIKLT